MHIRFHLSFFFFACQFENFITGSFLFSYFFICSICVIVTICGVPSVHVGQSAALRDSQSANGITGWMSDWQRQEQTHQLHRIFISSVSFVSSSLPYTFLSLSPSIFIRKKKMIWLGKIEIKRILKRK